MVHLAPPKSRRLGHVPYVPPLSYVPACSTLDSPDNACCSETGGWELGEGGREGAMLMLALHSENSRITTLNVTHYTHRLYNLNRWNSITVRTQFIVYFWIRCPDTRLTWFIKEICQSFDSVFFNWIIFLTDLRCHPTLKILEKKIMS